MKRIGIIAALLPEADALLENTIVPGVITPISSHVYLLVCGMGAERARNAAQKMVVNGAEALISWGMAGSLVADIKPGALMIPETILASNDKTFNTSNNWRRTVVKTLGDCPDDIYLGQLSDSMQVLTSSKEKYLARQQGDSLAVDMESAAIAEIAVQEQVPFIAIRAISDSANMSIPESILAYTDPYGTVRLSKLIPALMRRPMDIPKVLRLARGYRAAARTLKWSGKKLIQSLSEGA